MKIKRCPCCGSKKVKFSLTIASDKDYGYISCKNCKLTQGETSHREKSEAIKLWNTRFWEVRTMKDLSKEYRKAESVFLQKNRKLFEPYIELKNDEVTEEQLVKEGNEIGCYYDDLRNKEVEWWLNG